MYETSFDTCFPYLLLTILKRFMNCLETVLFEKKLSTEIKIGLSSFGHHDMKDLLVGTKKTLTKEHQQFINLLLVTCDVLVIEEQKLYDIT